MAPPHRGLAQAGSAAQAPLQTDFTKARISAELDRIIPGLLVAGDVPGIQIAVIKDGQIILNRGFGVVSAATKAPVTESTVFEAASLSKPVFAYAVLKLVDQGKLELDKPLSQYLEKPYVEGDDRLKLITARRVLTHTTGLPNWRPNRKPLKIMIQPGSRFSYSGEGFVYLQKVVERLSGKPLEELMKSMVFDPLGMTSSSYVWQTRYEALKAIGHDGGGNPTELRRPTQANAAASLQTTSQDYAKFVIAVMNGVGLKDSTSAAMLTPQISVEEGCRNCIFVPEPGKLSTSLSWGLGVGLQKTNDGVAFWHWGDNEDVHCYMLGYPRQKIGIVVFTNSGYGHAIIPEVITQTIGGYQPAYAWIAYEHYNSPIKNFYHAVLTQGIVAVDEYREQRKRKTNVDLEEEQMSRLGHWLQTGNHLREAIEVFKLNSEIYPGSWNAFDSLGEAYMADGDKTDAIKSYEQAVKLNPNNVNGIEMLRSLRSKD